MKLRERDTELETLSAALEEARTGHGTTVLVSGDAGSGGPRPCVPRHLRGPDDPAPAGTVPRHGPRRGRSAQRSRAPTRSGRVDRRRARRDELPATAGGSDRRGRALGRRRLTGRDPVSRPTGHRAGRPPRGQLPGRGAKRRPSAAPRTRRDLRSRHAAPAAHPAVRRSRARDGNRGRARCRGRGGRGRRQPVLPDRAAGGAGHGHPRVHPAGRARTPGRVATGVPSRGAGSVGGADGSAAGCPGRAARRLGGARPRRTSRRPRGHGGAHSVPARAGQASRRAVPVRRAAPSRAPARAGSAGQHGCRTVAIGAPGGRRSRRHRGPSLRRAGRSCRPGVATSVSSRAGPG